ncbi:MAG: hypothetical protein J7K34_02955 [Flavobacteriaceae bacterium]|nr:hypothetical protein [Flavobacteriaceae bacterium]
MVRVPIRLGEDVFSTDIISENNKSRMCDAMHAFRLLMKVNGVEKFKAYIWEQFSFIDIVMILKLISIPIFLKF